MIKNKQSNASMKYSSRSKQSIQDEDYGDPNLKEAKEYSEFRSFRRVNEQGELEKFPFCCDLNELGQFGAGVELYFRFLKCFALVFFIMFLVTAYSLQLNFNGDGYSQAEGTIFIKTTLGNHKQ